MKKFSFFGIIIICALNSCNSHITTHKHLVDAHSHNFTDTNQLPDNYFGSYDI